MRIELDGGWADTERGLVHRDGVDVRLSTMETRLLAFLAAQDGAPVTQETLLQEVWGYGPTVASRTVRVTVGRLRKKLEADPKAPRHLLTEHGFGYRLVATRPEPLPAAAPARDVESGLVGRADDLAALEVALAAPGAWVSVSGPPGVGKTALAKARAPAGAVWVSLEGVRDGDGVRAALAAALDVDAGVDGASLGAVLAERAPPLVVLDGAAGVWEALPALVAGWRAVAAGVRGLVTATRTDAPKGWARVGLAPLPARDAEVLLRRHWATAAPDEADDPALPALARALDGLPLALELVAGWAGVLAPAEVQARLDAPLAMLDAGGDALRRALGGAWADLGDGDQRVLAALSAFAGAVPLDGAEAVAGPESDGPLVLGLRRLSSRSLVVRDAGGHRLLSAVRDQARRAAPDAAARGAARHRVWLETALRATLPALETPARAGALDRLGDLAADVQLALVDADASASVVFVRALVDHARARGPVAAALAGVLHARSRASGSERVALGLAQARLLRVAGRVAEAEATARATVGEATAAGHPDIAAEAREEVVRAMVLTGRGAEATEESDRAVADAPTPAARAESLRSRAFLQRARGDMAGALASLEAALDAARLSGAPHRVGLALSSLGAMLVDSPRIDEAAARLEAAAAELAPLREWRALAGVRLHQGRLAIVRGDGPEAQARCIEAAKLADRAGDLRTGALARWRAAIAAIEVGQPAAALQALDLALDLCGALGDPNLEAAMRVTLGNARLDAGDVPGARRAHGDALRMQRALGGALYVGSAALHAARSALAAGAPEAAVLAAEAGDAFAEAGIDDPLVDARTLQAVATGDRALLRDLPDDTAAQRALVAAARAVLAGRPAPAAAVALADRRSDVRFLVRRAGG